MPKHVKARAAQDEQEERLVRKLANSHHAPADRKWHARMVLESWAGKTPNEIAAQLDCHPQTVRIHLARFNEQGIEGLGMRPGALLSIALLLILKSLFFVSTWSL